MTMLAFPPGGIVAEATFTAEGVNDAAQTINFDANGQDGASWEAMSVNTGALVDPNNVAIHHINVDATQATGGSVVGWLISGVNIENLTWASAFAVGTGLDVMLHLIAEPFNQTVGIRAINGGTLEEDVNSDFLDPQTNTAIFDSPDDYIIIGSDTKFTEIQFAYTSGSNRNLQLQYEFSVGNGNYQTFEPHDSTRDARDSGLLYFGMMGPDGWLPDTDGNYKIKVIRGRQNNASEAVAASVKGYAPDIYTWDKEGRLTIGEIIMKHVKRSQLNSPPDGMQAGEVWGATNGDGSDDNLTLMLSVNGTPEVP